MICSKIGKLEQDLRNASKVNVQFQGEKNELELALKESEENYNSLNDDYNTMAEAKDQLNLHVEQLIDESEKKDSRL